MDLPTMADSRMDPIINAPCESINLTGWVFGLTDEEYQACSKDHIAAAALHLMANGCLSTSNE
jgi:hypothetical protein